MRVKLLSVKMTQDEAYAFGRILMRDQDTTNRYSDEHPASDKSYRLLTVFRRAVVAAGGEDMYPEMPHLPGIFEVQPERKRRRG